MSSAFDREVTLHHLSNKTVYSLSSEKEFVASSKTINQTWAQVASRSGFETSSAKRFHTTNPVPPVLYTLIKTHKIPQDKLSSTEVSAFKIRPIVSGCGGPADKVSWVVSKILSPLLNFIPAHLSNVNKLINKLQYSQNSLNPMAFCSFDVESLYTNVDNDLARESAIALLSQHKQEICTFGLSI